MLSALRSSVPESHRWHLLEHAGRFIRGVQQLMHVHAPLHTPPLLHVCTQRGAEERWVGFGSIHHCAVKTLTHASSSSSSSSIYSTSQQQEQHRIRLDSSLLSSYNCRRTHANYTPTHMRLRTHTHRASTKMRIVTYIYPHITHTHTHTHTHIHNGKRHASCARSLKI